MSILSTSPVNTRHFDMEIAAALGSMEAAIILQQLHYWTQKEGVGVIVEQVKYIYNTFEQWVKQQFSFLTVWKFRKGMDILRSLSIVKVIRYRAKEWNQTNYYSLDYAKLREWAEAESIEISEMWNSTTQDKKPPTLEIKKTKVSLNESKITTQKITSKQRDSDRLKPIAAANCVKNALQEEKSQKQSNLHSTELTPVPGQTKDQSSSIKSENQEERNVAKIDYIVNYKWKDLIPELDGMGIAMNQTVTSLLKLYSSEEVRAAIALLKARKREKHIPNVAGYFVSALKGDWGSKEIIGSEEAEVDTALLFRYWYDLARELGYCSGQKVREGEQWINLSGTWERWADAVSRGYSLEYLKKIMKRN
jgi:hypothetical protein